MELIVEKLLQDFEQGKTSRRQLVQNLALAAASMSAVGAAPAGAADSVVKAEKINHIGYDVLDYAKIRDFYAGLLGMQVSSDTGKKCYLKFGNDVLSLRTSPTRGLNHIAYTIANWDAAKGALVAELKRRGMPWHESPFGGIDTEDPEGTMVQFGGKDLLDNPR